MDKQAKLELLNSRSGFNRHNGIVIKDVGEGFALAEAELKAEALNPWGMAHGGLVYSLCDVAAGVAANLAERKGVTLSANIQYLHPSRGRYLRAEGRVIKDGRTVTVVETKVYNDENELTAAGTVEIFIIE